MGAGGSKAPDKDKAKGRNQKGKTRSAKKDTGDADQDDTGFRGKNKHDTLNDRALDGKADKKIYSTATDEDSIGGGGRRESELVDGSSGPSYKDYGRDRYGQDPDDYEGYGKSKYKDYSGEKPFMADLPPGFGVGPYSGQPFGLGLDVSSLNSTGGQAYGPPRSAAYAAGPSSYAGQPNYGAYGVADPYASSYAANANAHEAYRAGYQAAAAAAAYSHGCPGYDTMAGLSEYEQGYYEGVSARGGGGARDYYQAQPQASRTYAYPAARRPLAIADSTYQAPRTYAGAEARPYSNQLDMSPRVVPVVGGSHVSRPGPPSAMALMDAPRAYTVDAYASPGSRVLSSPSHTSYDLRIPYAAPPHAAYAPPRSGYGGGTIHGTGLEAVGTAGSVGGSFYSPGHHVPRSGSNVVAII